MSEQRPAHLRGPGECHDKNGIPIYPGDLLRSFHFTGPRRRKFYLYHVVCWEQGVNCTYLRMVPASYLDPATPRSGGDPLLDDDLARQSEVIDGPRVGNAILFTERTKKRVTQ